MSHPNYQTCAVRPRVVLSEWDILTSLPTALVILNAKGVIVWLNPSAEAMLGYGLVDTLWIHVIQQAFVPRDDDGHEVSLVDGRRVHVSISSLDSLPGLVITLSDISATRDYEQAKENETRLVAIGTMTAQLAHQIRTPLSSAMLFTDHLNNVPSLDERSRGWTRKLQESHASIEQQIQDLLLFARGASIDPKVENMNDFCVQLSRRAEPYLTAVAARLQLNNQLRIATAFIHMESLMGAVLNLVINALQSEANEIHLTLASMDDSGIQLSVEDNGFGMSETVKQQALIPFFTTKAQGTGLGLAVVFSVVKAHGGTVSLESVEGQGTQVTLYLPGEQLKD
ncbi:MAG: ATP-binding protein [Legionella sp.]|nr:ATP-binding protein [Legionella sp.]